MSRPNRSDSDSSDPGAAQFISNLSPRQLQHLQFAVPKQGEPERFSQFLEEPRQVPVPKRFTFDALDVEARKARKETTKAKEIGKHARKDSAKSRRSETSKSDTSAGSSSRGSVDVLKEVERVSSVVDWRFYLTGACICLLNLVAAWDVTTLSTALPTIATALHGSALDSFWLGVSFLVAATCFLPLFAAFSDIFGRKPILLVALTFFTAGSFISAVTGTFTGLHLGRSIQGMGAGGLYCLSNLVISDLISAVDRRKWGAFLGATWALGAISGPIIGGALAQEEQWRWIFWLNLPFCAIAFGILPFSAKLKPAGPGSILPKLRNIDWLGYVLFAGSLVSVLLGLTWGGTLHPWSNFRTTLPIQFGLIGLLVFLVWSWFSPFPSIISLSQFLDPTSLVTYFGAVVQGMIIFAALYFLPMYFSVAKPSLGLVVTGVCLCAWTVPLAVFALIGFFAVTRFNILRPMIWLGWFVVVVGIALMALLTRTSPAGLWIGIAIISGSGSGLLYPSLSTASIASLQFGNDDGWLAKAVVNFTFFQTFGQTLGVAIGSSVFQNELYKNLLENSVLKTSALSHAKDAVARVSIIRSLAGTPDTLKTQVSDAYVDSLRLLWIIMAALAGGAMVTGFFMKKVKQRNGQEMEMKDLAEAYIA